MKIIKDFFIVIIAFTIYVISGSVVQNYPMSYIKNIPECKVYIEQYHKEFHNYRISTKIENTNAVKNAVKNHCGASDMKRYSIFDYIELLMYIIMYCINWLGCLVIALFYKRDNTYKHRYGLLMNKFSKPTFIIIALYYIIDLLIINQYIIQSIIFSTVVIGAEFIFQLAFYQLSCKWLKDANVQ